MYVLRTIECPSRNAATENSIGMVGGSWRPASGSNTFRPFDHTPENVARVFRLIEEREADPGDRVFDRYLSGHISIDEVMTRLERRGTDRASVPEASVSRPSEHRDAVRLALQAELRAPRLSRLRRRADHVYERLARLARAGRDTAA